jgi:peptidoglycan/xylan/chitin deacetylase (PgdA/CDA1 family)
MMMRSVLGALSPAGRRARLTILILHRVLPEPDPLFPGEITKQQFQAICAWVRHWFNVMPLVGAARALRAGTLPARALAITFDDGYADNHDVALPILRSHGLTATFFVASGFLDGGRMWNDTLIESVRRCKADALDLHGSAANLERVLPLGTWAQRRSAVDALIGKAKYLAVSERDAFVRAVADRSGAVLPEDLMMSSAQVRALARSGMEVGGHTTNHPILARLADRDVRREIDEGRRHLEDVTGRRVESFAYPNGKPGVDYDDRAVSTVRELGFALAVCTQWGAARRDTDIHQLPRFMPWDHTRARFGLRLAMNLWQ